LVRVCDSQSQDKGSTPLISTFALRSLGEVGLRQDYSGLRWTQSTEFYNDVSLNLYLCGSYILKCSDGTVYTGCTTDIDRRIDEHNSHKNYYTRDKTPVSLITYIAFTNKYKAFEFEKYLKSGSGFAFRNRHLI
jgi:putative endonuclease